MFYLADRTEDLSLSQPLSSERLLQRGKGEGNIYVNLVKGGVHVIMYPVVGVTGDGSKV